MIDSELPTNTDESESANPKQSIDMYEHEPNEESERTSEAKPTTRGRRYPLREKRSLVTYATWLSYQKVREH